MRIPDNLRPKIFQQPTNELGQRLWTVDIPLRPDFSYSVDFRSFAFACRYFIEVTEPMTYERNSLYKCVVIEFDEDKAYLWSRWTTD